MTERQPPANPCPHRKVRGPQYLGESGIICEDCGENLPCPHPLSAQQTTRFLGGNSVTICKWCGMEF